jgi:hypothetical protein
MLLVQLVHSVVCAITWMQKTEHIRTVCKEHVRSISMLKKLQHMLSTTSN